LINSDLNKDAALINRIVAGDNTAFDELFRLFYAPLVLFAQKSFSFTREDAEDLTVELFGKLWVNRSRLREVEHLSPFIYTSARNACVDFIRKKQRRHITEVVEEPATAAAEDSYEREMIRAEVLRIIEAQVQALPQKCREIFILTYYDGLNSQQIAEKLHISVSNVTSQRNRALQLLKKELLDKNLLFIWLLLAQL
jgi:RNA polymerase sigma-70 factor (ECF subfamily)